MSARAQQLQQLHTVSNHHIQQWIESVTDVALPSSDLLNDDVIDDDTLYDDPLYDDPVFFPSNEPPAKRPRRDRSDNDTFTHPFNAILPSTPPITTMSDSSRKRGASEMDEVPDSTTPKSNRPLATVSMRPVAPKKRTRSASPTKPKCRGNLEMFEKPVYVKELESNFKLLPQDVKSLYSGLQKVRHKEDVIPHEVRDQVMALVGEDEARPYYFRNRPTPGAQALHDALCDIKLEAKAAAEDEYHETGWNHSVHTPVLRTVFKSTKQSHLDPQQEEQPPEATVTPTPAPPDVASSRFVSAMSATIWSEYMPTKSSKLPSLFALQAQAQTQAQAQSPLQLAAMGILPSSGSPSLGYSAYKGASTDGGTTQENDTAGPGRSDGKKVDYVLVLDAGQGSPLQKVMSFFLFNEGIERDNLPHVNQTLYRPLQWSPIACSIETKVEFQAKDPMLQLGTWAAAGHKRLRSLRHHLFGKVPSVFNAERQSERFPSSLLIEVVNHDWRLYFACDSGASIDLYGPLGIGSTRYLTEAYVLVAALEAIQRWIETTFHEGMEAWLMCKDLVDKT
ncbi:Uu.00g133530.m01.CDS01 [Anthostomella pinea]|uniref:Uu.00g133530.m01.CDS01 n=1 Tax=Anthostomella pinea TaxID=933095 RepID=A0AAI8YKR6_9PEZI|nr:Uu.00g133530.m01.CDS01 [Anthostomella pinea]